MESIDAEMKDILRRERDEALQQRDEFERKGKELCQAYGTSLITIADLRKRVAELEAVLKPLVDQGEPLRMHGELWTTWQVRVAAWKAAAAAITTAKV